MSQPLLHTRELSAVKDSARRALAYYDLFHYPLTAAEIRQFMDQPVEISALLKELQTLVDLGIIYYHHGFYSLQDNPLLAHRRRQGNLHAEQLLVKAQKIGRFLYRFPFVRAVGISGSLSKNYADEKADIDLFIITKANRLWIARSLMHFYKKFTFAFGKQHYYCMNYYIDEKALPLSDKNIFTAIEIKTLLPASGEKTMLDFFQQNQWANQFLPLCSFREQSAADPRNTKLKHFSEWMMNGRLGSWLEKILFNWTQRRWKNKAEKGKRNRKGQPMELNTGKHFARSNPGAFQEKVLAMYKSKLDLLRINGE